MTHRRQRPPEPPIPQPANYPRSNAAARRSKPRPNLTVLIVSICLLGIVLVAAGFVGYTERNPAARAADQAAGTSRKPVEKAPPVAAMVGDGTWLVGKQVKPGIYQSNAGALCYWERLAGLSGKYFDIIDNGGFRNGPTLVEIRLGDFAFGSQGCGSWVMVP